METTSGDLVIMENKIEITIDHVGFSQSDARVHYDVF